MEYVKIHKGTKKEGATGFRRHRQSCRDRRQTLCYRMNQLPTEGELRASFINESYKRCHILLCCRNVA